MIYYHNIISIYYHMSRLRTKNYISNLKKKKPRVFEMLRQYAEQVKPQIDNNAPQAEEQSIIGDNTLLQDGNTNLPLSVKPPKEWEPNP